MSWPRETGAGRGGAGGDGEGECSVTLDVETAVDWMSYED